MVGRKPLRRGHRARQQRNSGEPEYIWAMDAFKYGVQYAQDTNLLGSTDRDSYEETITGLTRQAVLLQEKIDALTSENNELHELLEENIPDNLIRQLATQEDEVDDLSLKVANYKDVIKLLVEMI